jgi:glutamyl-tRNA reductase
MYSKKNHISEFWVAGLNYKKTDAAERGQFAVNSEQYTELLSLAPQHHVKELFVLSTCNRTEIYGFASNPRQLIELICTQTKGDKVQFEKQAYIKNGMDAIEHLFHVSAGLNSQILGDYEILGQLKQAVKVAKKAGFINAFMERLLNSVVQASKAVKTHTELSGGTVSVSFAAVQHIKEHIAGYKHKKFLLIGTGKIGKTTCRNIVDYLHTKHVTLINRTSEKAERIASEMGLHHAPIGQLSEQIKKADIILVSTNAIAPIILKSQLEGFGDKLIIDLSVPSNVEKAAQKLPNIKLVNVDELSKIKDETLQKRMADIPKAEQIIAEHITEFLEWNKMRKYAPMLVAVKHKLHELNVREGVALGTADEQDERIQKVINNTATKVRRQNAMGCYFIEAINEFIS